MAPAPEESRKSEENAVPGSFMMPSYEARRWFFFMAGDQEDVRGFSQGLRAVSEIHPADTARPGTALPPRWWLSRR